MPVTLLVFLHLFTPSLQQSLKGGASNLTQSHKTLEPSAHNSATLMSLGCYHTVLPPLLPSIVTASWLWALWRQGLILFSKWNTVCPQEWINEFNEAQNKKCLIPGSLFHGAHSLFFSFLSPSFLHKMVVGPFEQPEKVTIIPTLPIRNMKPREVK